tara:strand:+ start:216 stop:506 length:291 start_codon:yes stop_codon:yes gene_type:complete
MFNLTKDDDKLEEVPELNIDDKKEDEAPEVESHLSILQKKLIEIEEMFEEQNESLNSIAVKKQELNKEEEAVKYELSGLHGAKVVLEQLIEEAKDS